MSNEADSTAPPAEDPIAPNIPISDEERVILDELRAGYLKGGHEPPAMRYLPNGIGLVVHFKDGTEDNTVVPCRLTRADRLRRQVEAGEIDARVGGIYRETAETKIDLTLNLDGTGTAEVATGVGFLDHVLTLFAKHSLVDLYVKAEGDLHVDAHHTVEDVGICLGKALADALGDKAGIRRYGHSTLPMDETLVTVALDLGGRPYLVWKADVPRTRLGDFDTELTEDFWQAVASNGLLNLHVLGHYGRNAHHVVEAIFKATARALRDAVAIDPRVTGVPSTKGTLTQ